MKKGDKLFVADLITVSFFSPKNLKDIASDEKKYYKTPFLFLISSYNKNSSLKWAYKNLSYLNQKDRFQWIVYKFVY